MSRPIFVSTTAPLLTLTEDEEIIRDALRWRALMSCEKIIVEATIPPRTAIHEAQNITNTDYINISFWTKSALPTTHFGIPILTAFADRIIESED